MKKLIPFLTLLLLLNNCLAQDNGIPVRIDKPGKQYRIVGELGKEFGTVLTVSGVIVDGPYKGHEGGSNLIVQVINDSLTQHHIQLPLYVFFGDFGKDNRAKLETGGTYRFRAYETGEFIGRPYAAFKEIGHSHIQNSGFYFMNSLILISKEKIDPIEWPPAGFLDRNALLSGIAKNEKDTAVIQTSKWKLRLIGCSKWTASEIGKTAEVYGTIRQTGIKGIYNIENGRARLVNLSDQLGKTVKLRGTAISMNNNWWFNYRGTDIYVEKMAELPGWIVDNHFRPMEITGILEQAQLPDIDELSLTRNPKLKLYYIVRKASWAPIEELLQPEWYD